MVVHGGRAVGLVVYGGKMKICYSSWEKNVITSNFNMLLLLPLYAAILRRLRHLFIPFFIVCLCYFSF
jgi:hypothetical protein